MANEPAKKTAAAPKTHQTDQTPAADGTAPVAAGRTQQGELSNAPLSTNPPRGVGEAPSNQIADEPAAAGLQEFMQERVDKEQAAGHRGTKMDTTPNENYTLRGVGKGLPTPETQVVTPRGNGTK
jgi:hypothetical protein